MQNKNAMLFALCIMLFASVGVVSAFEDEDRQFAPMNFTQEEQGIIFTDAVDLDTISVEIQDDKIEISSDEHTETAVKISEDDIEAIQEDATVAVVEHYTDEGLNDWTNVVPLEYENGYITVDVEFSSVTITPMISQIAGWNFESWVNATTPTGWYPYTAGGYQETGIPVFGNYSYGIHGAAIPTAGQLKQNINLEVGQTYKLGAYSHVNLRTSGRFVIGVSGTGKAIEYTSNTDGIEYKEITFTAVSPSTYITIFVDSSPNAEAYFVVDGIILSKVYSSTSATETDTGTAILQNFTYTPASVYANSMYVTAINSTNMSARGYRNVTAKIDGTTVDAYIANYSNDYIVVNTSGLSAASHNVNITAWYTLPPKMLTPANGSTITFNYPPMYSDVVFTWYNFKYNTCQIQIAEDSVFSNVVYSDETNLGTVTVSLPAGTYYWRVRSYDSITGTYGAYPSAYNVVLVSTSGAVTGTGVMGTVYYSASLGDYQYIPGAVVTVYNNTYTVQKTTGPVGYYQVLGLSNGTYYVKVDVDGYDTSDIAAVNVTAGTVKVQDIALQKEQSYFAPHDVRFKFKMHWYSVTSMENVTYSIYANSNTVALKSGVTDSTGSFVVSDMSQSVKYRIVASYVDSEGVTKTLTTYIEPSDTSYTILMADALEPDLDGFSENVNITVTKTIVNTTAANITVEWNDTTGNTTVIMTRLYGDNDTILDSAASVDAVGSSTWTVYDYTGKSYRVWAKFTHPDYGTVTRNFSVTFGGSNIPFAGSVILGYLAIFILLIVLTQFGKMEHATGSIAFVALAWVFFFVGMFDGFNKNTAIELGLTVATLYAIMAYVISRKEGGV